MGRVSKDGKSYMTDFYACAFPKLSTPQSFQNAGPAKYSVQILIPKSKKEVIKEITDWVLSQIASSALPKGKQDEAVKRALKNRDDDFFLFKDGDLKDIDKYPFYKGYYFINVKRPEKWGIPGCVYPDGSPIPEGLIDSEIYGGAIIRARIGCYAFEQPKPGATLQLLEIQKVKDGESHKPASEFDAVMVEDSFDEAHNF